ncbi:hypothetical protein Clacol_006292 [Clathrus columnatus]|uniref:HSF-type DNA-binding domain-containing protein n=1 Tax=Clathrus columnatus TaxID=1419009 RepID=A0AAV5AHT7_9AGAM|nr:hypothetical protein Clacol_006292 [Clathrus columnatus]
MALTTRKVAFTNPSRSTRQQIPPFLSKLYHMVNDPSTESLIRWSDNGDSFYVFDHERFAKEVLPHWFKHGNFGSFVRQLNNYGFHKVPHLQQGVLRSDAEAEISHFENQYFQRGQSDLLCLIQRKRQGHDTREDSPDFNQPAPPSAQANGTEPDQPSPGPGPLKGAVLDINGILNGIQAIKRHQHTISAELKELHQSNQGLWQEAYAARERHKKHHDTITRILKFLAGVFGQTTNSPRAQEVPHDSPVENGSVVQRRSNRLMIEAAAKNGMDTDDAKMNINDFLESLDFEGGQANDGDRFATVETAGSRAASPSPSIAKESSIMGDVPPSPAPTVATTNAATTPKIAVPTPTPSNINNNNLLSYPFPTINQGQFNSKDFSEAFPANFATSAASNPMTPNDSNALTCSTPPVPNVLGNNDSTQLHNALTSLLNNPSQLQRVLAAFQPQMHMTLPQDPVGKQDDVNVTLNNSSHRNELSSPILPDFRLIPDGQFNPSPGLSLLDPSTNLGILHYPSDDASFNALTQGGQQLQKNYKDTKEVEAEVNLLQGHIDSLIESLGLDPSTSAVLRGDHVDDIVGTSSNDAMLPSTSSQLSDANPDFDFDSFLTQDFDTSGNGLGFAQGFDLSSVAQTNGSEKIGAFLDEVQSVSNGSDITAPDGGEVQHASKTSVDGTNSGTGGMRKRKSDALDYVSDPNAAARTKKKR